MWKIIIWTCLLSERMLGRGRLGKQRVILKISSSNPVHLGSSWVKEQGFFWFFFVLSSGAALMASSEVDAYVLWLFSPFGVTQRVSLQDKLQSPLTPADLKPEHSQSGIELAEEGSEGCQQSAGWGEANSGGIYHCRPVTCWSCISLWLHLFLKWTTELRVHTNEQITVLETILRVVLCCICSNLYHSEPVHTFN